MGIKCFIKHLPNPLNGYEMDLALNQARFRVDGKGSKKIPTLRIEDWGFYPLTPFTVLSSKTSQ
jgi:hypothetical protein